MTGHDWLLDTWNAHIEDDSDLSFMTGSLLTGLWCVVDAKGMQRAARESGDELPAEPEQFIGLIPGLLQEVASGGLELSRMSPPPVLAENPHRSVGRNEPCPCGSGRKYKKCCLQ